MGRLPELLMSFTGQFHGFSGAALGDSVLGGVISISVVLSWAGIGALVEGLLDRLNPAERQSTAWRWAVRCAWGAGVSSLLWFFLGLAGLYIWPVALGLLLCGLLLFIRAWRVDPISIHSFVLTSAAIRRTRGTGTDAAPEPALRSAKNFSGVVGYLAFALAMAAMLLAGIAALCPPTAKDTLLYHIALPKAFVAARGLADVPNNIAQYYPLGAELNGTWGILLGRPGVGARSAAPPAGLAADSGQTVVRRPGEAAFGGIEFAYLPILALAIYGWSRRRGFTGEISWVAVALVVCIPTVYASASSGYNDIALALYLTLAIAAAEEFWRNPTRRTPAEIGLAIGFALGIKLLALFLATPLLVVLLLRLRNAEKQDIQGISVSAVFRRGVLAIALAAVLAGPWYVRNWVRTGSPVYPFYINLFGGHAPGWDEPRSLLDQVLNSRYGGYPKSALDYVAVPVRASLLAQPEIPRYFDGVLGISFLFGLPFLLIRFPFPVPRSPARNWGRTTAGGEQGTGNGQRAWIALILAGGFFAFWLFSSEQLRYLLPALPAVAVIIVGAVSGIEPETTSSSTGHRGARDPGHSGLVLAAEPGASADRRRIAPVVSRTPGGPLCFLRRGKPSSAGGGAGVADRHARRYVLPGAPVLLRLPHRTLHVDAVGSRFRYGGRTAPASTRPRHRLRAGANRSSARLCHLSHRGRCPPAGRKSAQTPVAAGISLRRRGAEAR